MGLVKPVKLNPGDKVATVSLSWGGAGDEEFIWRYNLGKRRLKEEFQLEVVEMENTLKGSQYIYEHPEKRAEDLMNAFKDPSIKGIFTCIGGDESIRILPYIDFDVIRKNPKVFIGYSDTTISHFICYKAGLSSFSGPSIMAELAENVEMFDYTKLWVQKVLFDDSPIGNIPAPHFWTSEYIPWEERNKNIKRKVYENTGYEILQGQGIVRGHLLGGCIEVLEMMKGTEIWPTLDEWENVILFLETSEDLPTPEFVTYWLRNYGSQGILQRLKGIIFAKPYDNQYYEEYKQVIDKVVSKELKLVDLPILYNVSFGHTAPLAILPYGAAAEINCGDATFSIVESGVV